MSRITTASTATTVLEVASEIAACRYHHEVAERLADGLVALTAATTCVVRSGRAFAWRGLGKSDAVMVGRRVQAANELWASVTAGDATVLVRGDDVESDVLLADLGAPVALLLGFDQGENPGFVVLGGDAFDPTTDRATISSLIALTESISGHVATAARLQEAAATDPASGLFTWTGLAQAATVGAAHRRGLVSVDVEGLTELAAGFGASSARSVLRDLGDRLTGLPGVEMVAAITPERLAVVVDGDVGAIGDQIVAVASEPIQVGRHRVMLRVRAGAAAGGVELSLRALLERAELARVEAVAINVAIVVHTEALAEGCNQRLRTVGWLWRALQQEKLVVFYQPQVDATGKVLAYEALVRWQRDDGTMVPPDAFLPVAEQAGMMADIDLYVLRRSCRQLKVWENQGRTGFRLAVNLSASTVGRPGIARELLGVIVDERVDPNRIEIEITETSAASETGWTSVLAELRDAGITVALDDFGAGYSSLGRIHRLPLDRLKIDRAFVADLGGAGTSLVRAVVALAEGLGLAVLAEGVEDAAQHQTLVALGVTELQGFYFGRPVPSSEVDAPGEQDD